MRVTIIPADDCIYVNDNVLYGFDFSAVDPNIHAIQYKDGSGHIEYVDGTPNLAINNIDIYQGYVTEFNARIAHIEALAANKYYGMTYEEETAQRLKDAVETATNAAQAHIDSVAQAKGYDSGMSCVSYAGGTHPVYSVEGAAFRDWRDSVWDYCNGIYADVQSGIIPMPTLEDYLAGIPEMVWPV